MSYHLKRLNHPMVHAAASWLHCWLAGHASACLIW
jgi:hypothetical protein